MNAQHDNLTITYLDTEDIHNPVSTFHVIGVHHGININEVVAVTMLDLSVQLLTQLDVLGFLREINELKENIETSPHRAFIVDKAYETASQAFNKLESFKLMMSLSQNKKKQPAKVTVYNQNGTVQSYAQDHRAQAQRIVDRFA